MSLVETANLVGLLTFTVFAVIGLLAYREHLKAGSRVYYWLAAGFLIYGIVGIVGVIVAAALPEYYEPVELLTRTAKLFGYGAILYSFLVTNTK